MADDVLTLTLRDPLKCGDIDLTELRLAEPLVGELEEADKAAMGVGRNIKLVSLIASRCHGQAITETAIRRMRQSDFIKAVDFFNSTATGDQTTGGA